jgi:hypothetical protein
MENEKIIKKSHPYKKKKKKVVNKIERREVDF